MPLAMLNTFCVLDGGQGGGHTEKNNPAQCRPPVLRAPLPSPDSAQEPQVRCEVRLAKVCRLTPRTALIFSTEQSWRTWDPSPPPHPGLVPQRPSEAPSGSAMQPLGRGSLF